MSPQFLAWPLHDVNETKKYRRKSRFVQGEFSEFRFEFGPSRVPGMALWSCPLAYGEAGAVGQRS